MRRVKLTIVLIVVFAGAGWLIYKMAHSREWLEFRSERFWHSLTHVHWLYLLLGAFFIYCSYFFRSLRWREFLSPIKTAGLGNIFTSTLIGFSAVALLGRPGELVRPLLIARKEKVTLSSQFGAWTLERIFDGLTVGTMMGATLAIFPPASNAGASGARIITHLKTAGVILCASSIVMAVLLSQVRGYSPVLMKILSCFVRIVPKKYRSALQTTLEKVFGSFIDGLASIETIHQFGICSALSVLVWIPVILTYWSLTQGLGSPMSSLNLGAVVLLMATTVAGSLAQLPGVGGGYQVATVLVLTQLFGIPLEIASTAAILLWVLCFMVVLIPGLPLAAREGLTWGRLRTIVRTGGLIRREGESTVTADS